MMMATETAVLYHLEDGEITSKAELNGVTWREVTQSSASSRVTQADHGMTIAKKIVVRVPAESAPGGFSPVVGDMIVHGACSLNVGESDVTLSAAGAVTVQTVSDNRQGHMPHWKLEAV
ncbi:DUF6751 family protein [Caproicibacterium amylolyticum]|uniref:Uncharacterized protein n=1 Tax=Caproicibacterium amylolyticum TaxID=2766537 RepID=A0A7G9WJF4_9FIRM|nr:DUF6751 family protein [Caproicibacterium amylolyticum]QNO18816.1 hypothetical protein H6X83_04050 [Caproicibacterium amylolyticum]